MPKRRKKNVKLSRKNLIKVILILTAVVLLIIIIGNLLISKRTSTYAGLNLNKKMDLNKVDLIESLDGIKVPVPKGYTASSVESERYVNGKYTEKKGNKQELTFSTEGEYPWTKREDDGVWQSGGFNINSATSVLSSNEFSLEKGGYLKVNWSVSSQAGYDVLYVTIINNQTGTTERCPSLSGTNFGTAYDKLVYTNFEKELDAGNYTITVTYSKDGSSNSGLDSGYVKNAEIISYDEGGNETITIKENGGFVIYEGFDAVTESNLEDAKKIRNQWVWVPIENVSDMYYTSGTNIYGSYYTFNASGYTRGTRTYEPNTVDISRDGETYYLTTYMNGISRYSFLREMQESFKEMIESTSTYKGFYIARYHTGNLSKNEPVVVKLNEDIASQTWYRMYQRNKRLAVTNENVTTNMIWGTQFDQTLKWLIDTKEKTYVEVRADSTAWGNYRNATFTYTNTSGGISTKSLNSQTRIPTGSTEYTNANNIYDLAGNVWDWTMESYGSYSRYSRGGSYFYSGGVNPAHYRYNNSPYNSNDYIGCRATLYIK